MQKELNPELFGEGSHQKTRVVEPASGAYSQSFQQVLSVDQKLADMRGQILATVEQVNRFVAQMNDFVRGSQAKFDKISAALVQLEKNDEAVSLDNAQKLSQLSQKLGERKALDMKVQEMVDRHNTVLRSYELRLSQLQKLISEREQQIMNLTAVVNESKMEISRLKRL